jgi:hypothetical protein
MNRRIVKLEELDVSIDFSNTFDQLIGLFTSCRNIKKFTLNTCQMDVPDWSRSLQTILPMFSELEELSIVTRSYPKMDLNEVFDVISSSCPNLQKLGVRFDYLEDAENYFHNSNLIIFDCECD